MKPSAIRLITMALRPTPNVNRSGAGLNSRQLTRLIPTTAAQHAACHQCGLNVSSKSALANSQNTTTLPVEIAIKGTRQNTVGSTTGAAPPAAELTACAADPSANAI